MANKKANTADLRKVFKAVSEENTVSKYGEDSWKISIKRGMNEAENLIDLIGLRVFDKDIEGSQWDWSNVYFVDFRGIG